MQLFTRRVIAREKTFLLQMFFQLRILLAVMKTKNALSQYNRLAILRGYKQAVSVWKSKISGTRMIELKTSSSSSSCTGANQIKSIEPCPWDSSRIFGQNFAIVTLVDGEKIKTGATVGEIKHSLKQAL